MAHMVWQPTRHQAGSSAHLHPWPAPDHRRQRPAWLVSSCTHVIRQPRCWARAPSESKNIVKPCGSRSYPPSPQPPTVPPINPRPSEGPPCLPSCHANPTSHLIFLAQKFVRHLSEQLVLCLVLYAGPALKMYPIDRCAGCGQRWQPSMLE